MSSGKNKNAKTRDRKIKCAKAALRRGCKRIERINTRRHKRQKSLWLRNKND